MKIVTVVGARPQFVKAASVSRAIAEHNATITDEHSAITEIIVHTGQHYDANMSDVFFEEMRIPKPDYFLEINSLSHGAMTGRMLEKIEDVLVKETPDYVLVYGDTNSTLAGALAAKKLHIKVVHVEAGLRSFNMLMPEEINRILTDRISDILCCPTETSVRNLQNEGFPLPNTQSAAHKLPLIVNTGDVMLDAAMYYAGYSADRSTIIKRFGLLDKPFALCTIHRAENTDNHERLSNIFEALVEICKEMQVVLPLHPRTRKIIESRSSQNKSLIDPSVFTNHRSLIISDPVGYFDMLELLKHTCLVLTDSGGLQKEAYFFHKPCVTLRDETEWVELVENGVNELAGASSSNILSCCKSMQVKKMVQNQNLYGTGDAGKKIVKVLTVA